MDALEARLRRRLGLGGARRDLLLAGSAFCYAVVPALRDVRARRSTGFRRSRSAGLLEEHPEHVRLLSGPGEVEIIRTTTKVLVQILLLLGLLTVGLGASRASEVHRAPWPGERLFLAGWLADGGRCSCATAPTRTRRRSWRGCCRSSRRRRGCCCPLAIPVRRIFAEARPAGRPPPATGGGGPGLHRRRPGGGHPREGRGEAPPLDRGFRRHARARGHDAADRHPVDRRAPRRCRSSPTSSCRRSTRAFPVVRGSIDTVVGIVHVKDLFEAIRAGKPPVDRRADARGVLRARSRRRSRSSCASSSAATSGWRSSWTSTAASRAWSPVEDLPGGDRRRDLRRARGRARGRSRRRRERVLGLRQGRTSRPSGSSSAAGPEEEEFTTVGGFLAARPGPHPAARRDAPRVGPALHRRGSGPPPGLPRADRADARALSRQPSALSRTDRTRRS
mgnify:CR=1 FL=1